MVVIKLMQDFVTIDQFTPPILETATITAELMVSVIGAIALQNLVLIYFLGLLEVV
ncbi:MAG: hypothetical protein V7K92_05445 [Nostoc sp.]|uniref:hypothetical protein n=1 Tax=Nostoc sp. TaxID=1180 RepID=UPI002FF23D2B